MRLVWINSDMKRIKRTYNTAQCLLFPHVSLSYTDEKQEIPSIIDDNVMAGLPLNQLYLQGQTY